MRKQGRGFGDLPQWVRHYVVEGGKCSRCKRELPGSGYVCTKPHMIIVGDNELATDCQKTP